MNGCVVISEKPSFKGRVRRKMRAKKYSKDEKLALTFDGTPVRKLYVTNLPLDTTWGKVHSLFSQFGEIRNTYIPLREPDDFRKLFAFVTYITPESAFKALRQSRRLKIGGTKLYISPADTWHQPIELPDGTIQWNRHSYQNSNASNNNLFEEDESEKADDEEGAVGGDVSKNIQLVYEEEVAADSINRLNDDCLRYVFMFLSMKERVYIERVCKRWQGISISLWKSIQELDFTQSNQLSIVPLTTGVLEQFLRRCSSINLRSINLCIASHKLSSKTLPCIAKHCPNLEELGAYRLNIGNRGLAHLAKSCKKLKVVNFYECLNYSDRDLNRLLSSSKELNSLDLTHSVRINGRSLTRLIGPVRRLSLDKCTSIFPQNLIAGLQNISATLTNLSLSACSALGCNDVSRIVHTTPNLQSLTLSNYYPLFDNRSLLPIGQLTKLKELNLSQNPSVNDDVLKSIVNGCEELMVLNLCGIFTGSFGNSDHSLTEGGISYLAKLKKLVLLNISYLDQATNSALKTLTRRSPPLKYLVCRGCSLISDDGCTNVVSLCNDLLLFDVSGCDRVTDITVKTAGDSVKLRTNNAELTLIVGGTSVEVTESPCNQLHLDMADNSEDHMRADFMDGLFFSPSDSDDDLDELCEHLGCNCGLDDYEYEFNVLNAYSDDELDSLEDPDLPLPVVFARCLKDFW